MAIAGGILGGLGAWTAGYGWKGVLLGSALGAITGATLTYGVAYGGPWLATQLARFLPQSIAGYAIFKPVPLWQAAGGGVAALIILGYGWRRQYENEKTWGTQPDPLQMAKIQGAVDLILADQSSELVGHRQMLRSGEMEFKVWDSEHWGQNPHFASSIVLLRERFVEMCDEKLLAGTIVHEISHSFQLPLWKGTPRGEIWAYTYQSEFMKRIGVSGSLSSLSTVYDLQIEETYLGDTQYALEYYGVDDPAITAP
jgi:hypothetical protein